MIDKEKFINDLKKFLKKYSIREENLKSISINIYNNGLVINPTYELEELIV